MFQRTKSIFPPYMSEEEFLAVLRAIVVRRRLNAPQKRGYDTRAFSRAFARHGHFDGGPGFIKTDDGQSGPIQEACRFLLGKDYKPQEWQEASKAIGLPIELAESIQKACDLSLTRDVALYHRILDACDLPSSDEDEEDIQASA
jgi:hypothetical protein